MKPSPDLAGPRHRLARPGRSRIGHAAGFAAGFALLLASTTAHAIDPGDASILSRQGQRLKVAIPFGSAPGERVPATRFSVIATQSLDGGDGAPDPKRFTISKPEHRNVVFLTSERPVLLERLRLVVSIAGPDPSTVTYDVDLPPAREAVPVRLPARR